MNKTSIEWTDFTWNPVTGCHKVSPGCKNCYAETLTNRFAKPWGVQSFRDVTLHEDRLTEPFKNRKKWAGKKVFVCSMSDLFQEQVPFNFIVKVYQAIASCPDTTFQILTKRPERCLQFYKWGSRALFIDSLFRAVNNIWIGTSVENQETANLRIPYLLQIPAKVRFLSCEPLLDWVNIDVTYALNTTPGYRNFGPKCSSCSGSGNYHDNFNTPCPDCKQTGINDKAIHWVIVGGESGSNARPMHPDWVRRLRNQCASAKVPFFFKQWGEWIDNQNCPSEYRTYNCKQHVFDQSTVSAVEVWRIGKSKSGNLLDGVQHLNFPTT